MAVLKEGNVLINGHIIQKRNEKENINFNAYIYLSIVERMTYASILSVQIALTLFINHISCVCFVCVLIFTCINIPQSLFPHVLGNIACVYAYAYHGHVIIH